MLNIFYLGETATDSGRPAQGTEQVKAEEAGWVLVLPMKCVLLSSYAETAGYCVVNAYESLLQFFI